MTFDPVDPFLRRHIGPRASDLDSMLAVVGVDSLDALMAEAIPESIRLENPLELPEAENEYEYLKRLRLVAEKNRLARNFIGMGYYDCITPSVILRNVMENPSWYTPYTPYQAEIAQGRLESLLNFQTMVSDLTAMEVANASLLDEATAAAEAMVMLHRVQQAQRSRESDANIFFVSERCFPQTIDVLRLRAEPLDIELKLGNPEQLEVDDPRIFGALLQYPDSNGELRDLTEFIKVAHGSGVLVAVATDLLCLAIATPPGEMGADVVVGNSQRLGVPMGHGGPHAAFFATRQKYVRQTPGRIIGVSMDAHGEQAYRMALQTREQHIRRERATSNICTAQALLANMAAMYAVYHGPKGLRAIASRVHGLTNILSREIQKLGFDQKNKYYFDTLRIEFKDECVGKRIFKEASKEGINFRYFPCQERGIGSSEVGETEIAGIGISLDETTTEVDVQIIVDVLVRGLSVKAQQIELTDTLEVSCLPDQLRRKSAYLTHPVFNSYHSESQMMRYIKSLERKDIGLDTSMIPLGSCTMKLNAASEMIPITWPEFSKVHPFAPADQVEGYLQVFRELEASLCELTGFSAVSLQPNSGAQGEFSGLMVIRAYHRARGERNRNVVLIPSSAHGTNPASGVLAGMKVVVVACDEKGNVDVGDLQARAMEHSSTLAALMVTYPSTHGVFEERIQEMCGIVHEHGGQVYMDGANMNAQVGLTSPAAIGADICHLNLHKTFSIPHGGGGPGMGPIGVASHLAPYLPGHILAKVGGDKATHAVSATPWGSSSILLISYGYIRMLGATGVTEATRYAILNANYIKSRLEHRFNVLYTRDTGRVAHEMIFDLREFKVFGVEEGDVAKRLMDYGFHAPTVSFPVPGTVMIEPTESEPKEELDRFCEAMLAIRDEIEEVVTGRADPKDNVLKNSPHTIAEVVSENWSHPYSREKAVYPLPFVKANKFWPAVGRINNPYGDRHLICSCPSVAEYIKNEETASVT